LCRPITNNQHHLVPQFLESTQFAQTNGMADVHIGLGGIKALF